MVELKLTSAQGRLLQQALQNWHGHSKWAEKLDAEIFSQIRNCYDPDDWEAQMEEAEKNADFFGEDYTALVQVEIDDIRDWERGEVEHPFAEQKDIDFPLWMRNAGLEDRSWRNDACARAEMPLEAENLPAGQPGGDTPFLRVWCWPESQRVRDRQAYEGAKRWVVELALDYEQTDSPEMTELLQSNDPHEVLALIDRIKARLNGRTGKSLRKEIKAIQEEHLFGPKRS